MSGSVLREPDEDRQRLVERLIDQPRDLGLVRERKVGIEIRLERKLAQHREAERVDRADLDVGESIPQLVPPSFDRKSIARPRDADR